MTNEEAIKVVTVLTYADGGCPSCVSNLIEIVQKVFPEFAWDKLSKSKECEAYANQMEKLMDW